jgi:hypothetical protein
MNEFQGFRKVDIGVSTNQQYRAHNKYCGKLMNQKVKRGATGLHDLKSLKRRQAKK